MTKRWLAIPAVLVGLTLATLAAAQDWPQWRGPQRNGVAPAGPALADAWPKEGPKKLWQSEKIQSGAEGGLGSVAVADGRAFVYANWKIHTPIDTRLVTQGVLRNLGWLSDLPEDLAKKLEAARTSSDRAALKGDDLKKWIQAWVKENLADPTTAPSSAPTPLMKKFGGYVQGRLNAGASAVSWEELGKLKAVVDKEFATQAELVKWMQDNEISGNSQKQVIGGVAKEKISFKDMVFCLDAETGQTQWKKEFPGTGYDYGASSTPAIAGGRCYIAMSNSNVYCLDAKSGEVVWQAKLGKGGCVSSSFLVADNVAYLLGGQLTAFDAEKGAVLWAQPKVGGSDNSPVLWAQGQNRLLLVNTPGGVNAVDLAKGDIRWKVPGGSASTVAVEGDIMVAYGGGLFAYRISPEKAEKLWDQPKWQDRGASPIIYQKHAYVVGGRVACVELESGQVKWEAKMGGEISSPALADGKIISAVEGSNWLLLCRANPEKYEQLAKVKLSVVTCVSPAIVNGRLFLRTNDGVSCFDLTAAANAASAPAPAEAK